MNDFLNILDIEVEKGPSKRDIRKEEVRKLKSDYGMFTHCCRGAGDWMALSMPECVERLKEYGLTDEEKTNGMELMAGYCRLLDEAGLIEEGHKTEHAAVTALAERLRKKNS